MADVVIKVRDNGSLMVTGAAQVVDAEGNVYEQKETYYLCRCGQSSNKPFCDGTHGRVGFDSTPRCK